MLCYQFVLFVVWLMRMKDQTEVAVLLTGASYCTLHTVAVVRRYARSPVNVGRGSKNVNEVFSRWDPCPAREIRKSNG